MDHNPKILRFRNMRFFFLSHDTNRKLSCETCSAPLRCARNNVKIDNYDHGPFLGVEIDSKLKFRDHIDTICNKISRSIGIMYKLKNFVPTVVLKQIYYSLVYPYLNYCICIYGGTYNVHMNRLVILQKRIVRLICKAPFLAHTSNLFHDLKFLKICDIYKYTIGIYMYANPDYRNSFDRNHDHSTRNRSTLRPVRPRLTVCENSLSVVGPNIWNSIPDSIRNCLSRDSFKFRFKQYLIELYI